MYGFEKQPRDTLDYDIVLTQWLNGDDIEACTVEVPDGISWDQKILFSDRIKLWISGGTDRMMYKFAAIVRTEMGRHKEIDFQIRVIDR